MKHLIQMSLIILLFSCSGNKRSEGPVLESEHLMIGERIDGPANVRDTINGGKVLFSLNDNLLVECTEEVNNWNIVGTYVKLNTKQLDAFRFLPGDTLFDVKGTIVGNVKSETELYMASEEGDGYYGLITGYTHKQNIKPESVLESAIAELINNSIQEITIEELQPIIKSFRLETCSPVSMGDEKGEWYFTWDNTIDDPSPCDRVTFIIENEILIGIVHARKINFKNRKTIDLAKLGRQFTAIGNVSDTKIKELIADRVNWYNSVD
mgnify:CR=1 FL=1